MGGFIMAVDLLVFLLLNTWSMRICHIDYATECTADSCCCNSKLQERYYRTSERFRKDSTMILAKIKSMSRSCIFQSSKSI
ncbi:hypothetical protein V1504DRAFT_72522 [Lipomyces starkeyi]